MAARNLGHETPGAAGVVDIVDALECVPLWIADPERDRTEDVVALFRDLAATHDGCRLAAATAASMRRD